MIEANTIARANSIEELMQSAVFASGYAKTLRQLAGELQAAIDKADTAEAATIQEVMQLVSLELRHYAETAENLVAGISKAQIGKPDGTRQA